MAVGSLVRDSFLQAEVVVGTVAVVWNQETVLHITLRAQGLAGAAVLLDCLTGITIEIGCCGVTRGPLHIVACIVNTTVEIARYFS